MKSKDQQIQFFKQCLLPQYDIATDRIDFEAYVDSTLSTSENWKTIKEEYGLDNQVTGELEFVEQKITHLAQRLEEVELKVEELVEDE